MKDARLRIKVVVVSLVLATALVAGLAQPESAGAASSALEIDAYLAARGSSLAGLGSAFYGAGQTYGIDPAFLVAIAGAESGFGAFIYHNGGDFAEYNAWNWFYAEPRWASDFASWDEGLDRVARGLSTSLFYFGGGRYSVVDIAPVYCPEGTQNWVDNVTTIMRELGGNPGDTRWAGETTGPEAATSEQPLLVLQGTATLSRRSYRSGEPLEATFTVKNAGAQAGTWDSITLMLAGPRRRSLDAGPEAPLTLQPGEESDITVATTLPVAGTWSAAIWVYNEGEWSVLGANPLFGVEVGKRSEGEPSRVLVPARSRHGAVTGTKRGG